MARKLDDLQQKVMCLYFIAERCLGCVNSKHLVRTKQQRVKTYSKGNTMDRVLHVYAFSKTEMKSCAFLVPTNHQVIGLSSSEGSTRRRRRSVANASGGALEGGGVTGEKREDGQACPASPVNGAEKEDPDVIIARRNAEHRRMQVWGTAATQMCCDRMRVFVC